MNKLMQIANYVCVSLSIEISIKLEIKSLSSPCSINVYKISDKAAGK